MKECDKRQNHINSKLHMIYIYVCVCVCVCVWCGVCVWCVCGVCGVCVVCVVCVCVCVCVSSNNARHPVTETFTYTSPKYTSLHLSTLHFLSFKLHPTTLHCT